MVNRVPPYVLPVLAGRMRTKIAIQAATQSRGAEGESYPSGYATITSGAMWSEIVPLRGDEVFQAMQTFGSEVIQFRVRYLSTITIEHFVLYASILYDIVEIIDPGERHRELVLRCIERKGDTV